MILNFALFQLGWFACVLGAAHGYALEGALAAALIVVGHIVHAKKPGREAALAGAAALLGAAFEGVLVLAGWVRPEGGIYWLVALWALFATTLNSSLRGLQPYPLIAALAGAVGGPLAYYAGARLGALDFLHPLAMLAALAAGWALATPSLLFLARRLDCAS